MISSKSRQFSSFILMIVPNMPAMKSSLRSSPARLVIRHGWVGSGVGWRTTEENALAETTPVNISRLLPHRSTIIFVSSAQGNKTDLGIMIIMTTEMTKYRNDDRYLKLNSAKSFLHSALSSSEPPTFPASNSGSSVTGGASMHRLFRGSLFSGNFSQASMLGQGKLNRCRMGSHLDLTSRHMERQAVIMRVSSTISVHIGA